MSFHIDSAVHKKRRSQNLGVGICLVLFMGLIMILSLVKLTNSGPVEGYDHAPRPTLTEGASE